jgi:hypothetical protein
MTTKLTVRSVHAGTLRTLGVSIALTGALLAGVACSDFFNVTNTNQPLLDSLLANPTRDRLSAAAIGIFGSARTGIQSYIWRLGSMGREGINLSGNNQPDYQEPYYGPLQGTGFGGSQWTDRYQNIRNINVYLNGVAANTDLSVGEKAASRGMANTMKALAFLYVVLTRDSLGAPIDVDRPVNASPAPFVSRDSVYRYILDLLDGALVDLRAADAASAAFPFPIPPGFSGFDAPATFKQFNRAVAAKAAIMRASAAGCGVPCYTRALSDLDSSFLDRSAATAVGFATGAYFDFSNAAGDISNGLSEPLNGVTFYALDSNVFNAQTQVGGQRDQRVLDKIAVALDTQRLGGIPIPGTLKFTVFFTAGKADPSHQIPIIRNEELMLLDAEAQWFAGAKAAALSDIDSVRINAGRLPPTTLTVASADAAFVTELLYNRRYSLLWEQGTRWVDARRFGRLSSIPPQVAGGSVPVVMPVPDAECSARGLPSNCTP